MPQDSKALLLFPSARLWLGNQLEEITSAASSAAPQLPKELALARRGCQRLRASQLPRSLLPSHKTCWDFLTVQDFQQNLYFFSSVPIKIGLSSWNNPVLGSWFRSLGSSLLALTQIRDLSTILQPSKRALPYHEIIACAFSVSPLLSENFPIMQWHFCPVKMLAEVWERKRD